MAGKAYVNELGHLMRLGQSAFSSIRHPSIFRLNTQNRSQFKPVPVHCSVRNHRGFRNGKFAVFLYFSLCLRIFKVKCIIQ